MKSLLRSLLLLACTTALAGSVAASPVIAPTFTEAQLYQRHYDTVSRIVQNMPAANKWSVLAKRSLPAGTFASNVVGRMTPFAQSIKGADLAMDYVYGTFGSNSKDNTLPLFPGIESYNITAFANTNSVAHANVDMLLNGPNGDLHVRFQAIFRFVENAATGLSEVSIFDFYFLNMNAFFAELHGDSLSTATTLVGKTCAAQRVVCGNDFDSVWPLYDCEISLAFYTSGAASTLSDNTVLCRAAETNLAFLRKDIHCNNIGASGGSNCLSSNYNDYFKQVGPEPFLDEPLPGEDASVYTLFKEHLATVNNIYTLTTYPTNLGIVKSGVVPDRTFSSTAYGRIWPVGTFTNTEDTVEYQFGIFGNANSSDYASALIPVIQSFKVVSYVNSGKVAASAIDYVMRSPLTNLTYPLRVQGFWRLNDAYQVDGYDVEVQNTGRFYSEVGLNIPAFIDRPALAIAVCASQSNVCVGVNQQYGGPDQPQCFPTLAGTIPLGDFNQILANSLTCRSIHVNLAFLRPDIHCPHVGPTGGHKCVDDPYEAFYQFTQAYPAPFLN